MTLLNGALLNSIPFSPQFTERTISHVSPGSDLIIQPSDQVILCDLSAGALPGPLVFVPVPTNKGQQVQIVKIDTTLNAVYISDGVSVVGSLDVPAAGDQMDAFWVLSRGTALVLM